MANRIEKKAVTLNKGALKINNPSVTFKKAPATNSREFEPAAPARTTKNLTRFKK